MSNTKGSSHVAGPMFAIHEDVQVREPAQTPKQVVMSERKPLSSRKITKEEARFNPIDKILQVTTELSFINAFAFDFNF